MKHSILKICLILIASSFYINHASAEVVIIKSIQRLSAGNLMRDALVQNEAPVAEPAQEPVGGISNERFCAEAPHDHPDCIVAYCAQYPNDPVCEVEHFCKVLPDDERCKEPVVTPIATPVVTPEPTPLATPLATPTPPATPVVEVIETPTLPAPQVSTPTLMIQGGGCSMGSQKVSSSSSVLLIGLVAMYVTFRCRKKI